jgi:hypothetical protein
LSFEVYEGIGDEIVSYQPHHTEGDELKQDSSFLWVEPEGYFFSCCAILEAFHLLSKNLLLHDEVCSYSSSEDKLLCLGPVVFQ